MPNATDSPRIEVLKPGVHVDVNGTKVEFSEADLQAIAEVYKPELHEAPFVVGHPKMDAPAYGWAKRFVVDGSVLLAEGGQVEEQFAGLCNEGRFKKISLALYSPGAKGNPCPGHWYPKHVGFLGAKPPAIKGLRSVEFSESEDGVLVFGDHATSTLLSLFKRVRDWMLVQHGQETADRVLPAHELEWADRELVAEQVRESMTSADGLSPAFAEGGTTGAQDDDMSNKEEMARLQQEVAEANRRSAEAHAELQRRREADERAEADRRHAEAVQFAEGLVAAGKLPVERQASVVALHERLAAPDADGAVLTFGEGDQALSATALLAELLQNATPAVEFGERVTRQGRDADALDIDEDDVLGQVQFGEGANVDPERLDLHNKARALMQRRKAAGAPIDYMGALRAVQAGQAA